LVSPIAIVLVIVSIIGFLGGGGVEFVRSFFPKEESDVIMPGNNPHVTVERAVTSEVVVPFLQSGAGGAVPTKPGSALTIERIESSGISRRPIAEKRKFVAPTQLIQTQFDNPIIGGSGAQRGFTQFSTGESFRPSKSELVDIRKKDLTEREREDLERLIFRFDKKKSIAIQQRTKRFKGTDPRQLILQKREQEALSKKQLIGRFGPGTFTQNISREAFRDFPTLTRGKPPQLKLFAKPGFVFGGVSEQVFRQQRAEKGAQEIRIAENRARAEQQRRLGGAVEKVAGLSRESQALFLRSKGIALRGGAIKSKSFSAIS